MCATVLEPTESETFTVSQETLVLGQSWSGFEPTASWCFSRILVGNRVDLMQPKQERGEEMNQRKREKEGNMSLAG